MDDVDPASLSDPDRLAALGRYGVLGSLSEEAFGRVANLAARLLDAPMAGVHFVNDHSRWAGAQVGHDAQQVAVDVSLSARELGTEELFVVEDAADDPRFQDNPLVAGGPAVRFYAGAAITTPAGHALGRLCVLDPTPRPEGLPEHDCQTLRELAGVVMDELAHRAQPRHREEILESITDAFYALDDEWRFTYINQQAEALLECSREEMLGEVIWEVFPETKELPNYEEYHRAVETGEPAHFEAYSPPFEAWFSVNAYPFDGGLSVYFNDVTARKEREHTLKEREEYLSVTLSSIGDAVIATDRDGRVTEMNAVAERLTGWSHADVEGRPLEDIFQIHNAKTGAPVESPVQKVLREGKTVGLANHTVLTARDGTEYQIADSAAPIRTDEDDLLGVVMVFRDVTDEYERREAIKEQRERLEMALIGGGAGMWDWDMQTDDAVYDERWADILGYSLDEVESDNSFFERHTHPDDLERVYDDIDRHARGEIPYLDQEIRMRHKDGSWRWVLDRGRIVERAADGTPLRMVGTHVDITERKEAEQRLRLQLDTLRQVATGTPLRTTLRDLIAAIEAQCPGMIGSVLFCDRAQGRIQHGVAPHLPDAYNAAIDGVEIGPAAGSCGTAMHERAPVIAEDIESDPRWADYRDLARSHGLRACWSVPIFDSNDEVLGTFALYHEQPTAPTEKERTLIDQARSLAGVAIERHRTAETLRDREQRVEALYDAMSILTQSETPHELAEVLLDLVTDTLDYPVCAVRYVEDNRLVPTVASPPGREILGPHADCAVDGPHAAAEAFRTGTTLHYNDAAEANGIDAPSPLQSVAHVPLGPYGSLSVGMTESGSIPPFDVRLLDVLAQNAESVLRRIDHEQELVDAKETAEKMSRLKSAFLANISHEIRTPLTSILGFAEAIGGEVEGARRVEEVDLASLARFSSLIEQSGQRLMDTLTGVLNLSKLQAGEMTLDLEPVDLAAEAAAAAHEFAPQADGAGVALELTEEDTAVWARADRSGVQIVLRNLLSNAIKYTEEGGTVWIRARTDGEHAVLEVEDTGIGMDPNTADVLFEAFKQASEGIGREYEGTGLGLTVTKEVLDQMDGAVAVETEQGEGSRSTVWLPRAAEEGEEPERGTSGS
ncbi:PAS domain S-box-containing protein [Salinibacter ruber]|uniref:histidine kinase n=2 Tax=Salinibacter ruber TaxID=146919 RepID=A0A9X2Q1P4_9BACT|nr:PAS domain S-box protein [Salinibacter ruber]MCS3670723.1 PAS domain S-box-containing protein [Salinibacter ruber]MCS3708414.1 PAS domain S-box-containing protein [Salinibacter ruber]